MLSAISLSKAVGTFLLIAGAIAFVVFFAVGAYPGVRYERDGYLDASHRCPSVASDASFDPECVERLVAQGPLYLGGEALIASFVCGGVAIFGSWLTLRGSRSTTPVIVIIVAYILVWALLIIWNAREGERLSGDSAQVIGTSVPSFLAPTRNGPRSPGESVTAATSS